MDTLWIVDAFNLMRRDSILRSLEQDRGTAYACTLLESQLGIFRSRKGRGHSVLLVYDGAPRPGAASRTAKGLRIVYPSVGLDADLVIVEQAKRAQGRQNVIVVSSDRADIGSKLRGLDVHWMRVENFQNEFWKSVGRGAKGAGITGQQDSEISDSCEKPPAPKGAHLEYWFEEFGVDYTPIPKEDTKKPKPKTAKKTEHSLGKKERRRAQRKRKRGKK